MRRLEDERLITGRGRFVDDLVPEDAVHLWFVRSPMAHGVLVDVDLADALVMPGVVAAFGAADLGLPAMPDRSPPWFESHSMHRYPLAVDRVRYVGEPVAVVVAESRPLAEDAAAAVWPDIEPLTPVTSVAQAVEGETLLFPEVGSNVVVSVVVDEGPEPERTDLVDVTVDVDHPRLAPSPIEPLAILATPEDGRLHVNVGHQAPHELKADLTSALDLAEDAVHVTVLDVGGAFGMKRLYPEYLVACKVAMLLERPVAWIQTRREIFSGGSHGRSMHHRVVLSAAPDGRVHSADIELVTDAGAYPHLGSRIGLFSRLVASGLYDIPRIRFDLESVVTNKAPVAPYRGAGRPEATLAIERAMDAVARRLGIDPVDVRRRNFVSRLPHVTAVGARYDSGDYEAALDRALALIGYDRVRAEQRKRRNEGGTPLGIGISSFVERAGGAPDSGEYASARIDPSGRLVVGSGSAPAGQGHETVWRKIAARVFDMEPGDVVLHVGDTDEVPHGTGTFASRSVQVGGSALHRTTSEVLQRAKRVAAALLEASESDIEAVGGQLRVAGAPGSSVSLADLAAAATEEELFAEEFYVPGSQTFPYGVHVAVVEVDQDTGLVTVGKMVAVDDVGTVIDDMTIEGQLIGSVAQGMGATLLEEFRYDDLGQPITATFMDYLLPSASLAIDLESDRLMSPAPSNPLGAKGAGEGGCIGMPAAIVNATIDALVPYGVTDLQIPLRPSKVWAAIEEAGGR